MEAKYRIDTEENREFLKSIRMDLLKFASGFPSPGGSAWYLGDDGSPMKEKDRETHETCRMVYVYCLGEMEGFPGSRELVDKALGALRGEMKDKVNGGWYTAITEKNTPTDGKWCYVHAFVIFAASCALALKHDGAEELLKEALETYDKYFWEDEKGMSCDTWDTAFSKKETYRGLNANMHSVEAFLTAADCAGKEEYRKRAGRMIDNVIPWAKNNNWRLPEHYSEDWVPEREFNKDHKDDQYKPYGATPGHAFEWARLIVQWALSVHGADSEGFKPYLSASESLFNQALSDAWNADGAEGIVYTTDWEGKPVVHDRMYWVLAEAIDTTAVLYRFTGKELYAEWYEKFMKFLDETVLDHVHGSWFHQLDKNNELTDTVWPGKPDAYHAIQATIIPYAECKSLCAR